MTKIPSKVDGPDTVGLGYWPHQVNAMLLKELQKSHNQLIDYITAREELGDARHKELTSRIDTITGNQLEMKRGDGSSIGNVVISGFEYPLHQPKRWRANYSRYQRYYFVRDNGDIERVDDTGLECDEYRYNTANYFSTSEAAEAYKAKLLSDNAQV